MKDQKLCVMILMANIITKLNLNYISMRNDFNAKYHHQVKSELYIMCYEFNAKYHHQVKSKLYYVL